MIPAVDHIPQAVLDAFGARAEWHRSHQEILDHVARMKRVDVEETG